MKCALFTCGLALLLAGCGLPSQERGKPVFDLKLPTLNTSPGYFASCAEIQSWRAGKSAQWTKYSQIPVDYPGMPNSVSSAGSQRTNVQEHGIDEPDMVKEDDRSYFVARTASVEIVDKDSLRVMQTLALSDLTDIQLVYAAGKLAVMGNKQLVLGMPPTQPYGGVYVPPPYDRPSEIYSVRTYERGRDGQFALADSRDFEGHLVGARLTGTTVTLVLLEWLDWDSPITVQNGKVAGVNCAGVQKPIVDDFNGSLLTIHSFAVDELQAAKSYARFGGADQIYMGPSHLFVATSGYSWFWGDARMPAESWQDLIISKFDLSGGPRFAAAGMVKGSVRNQFAFHEDAAADVLHVATSMGMQTNHLWALAQSGTDLGITGLSEDFGQHEDIRSVRYIGDKAYVVTFQKTDPLFVIDLAHARSPKVVAQLDVPGFSAYLHPLANGKLLGIGYGAVPEDGFSWLAGVQVSTFDISNPIAPAVLTRQDYGGRYSHADVGDDHHAFFFDESSGLLALPVRLLKPSTSSDPSSVSGELEFSGAMLLNLNSPQTNYLKITHWDWIPDQCRQTQAQGAWWQYAQASMDVRRVFKAGDHVISVSPFGVQSACVSNRVELQRQTEFADPEGECNRLMPSRPLPY